MSIDKTTRIAQWREHRDFQNRGITWSFKATSTETDTGTGCTSKADDETVLALAGLLADYRITLEAEVDDFTSKPYRTREIVISTGPHAGRYQILNVREDELGALYQIDLGALV